MAAVLGAVYAYAHESAEDFDGLDVRLAPTIEQVRGDIARAHPHLADGFVPEIVLAGWSRRAQSMQGSTFQMIQGSARCARVPIEGGARMHGAPDGWEGFPDLSTHAGMERVARRMVRLHRAKDAKVAVGGDLILADVSRIHVALTRQCALG